MHKVLFGAPFARGEPVNGDYEFGIVGSYNAIDRAFVVQWESTTEAVPMSHAQISKHNHVGNVDSDGHATFNISACEDWNSRVTSLACKAEKAELDQWRRGKRRRIEQVDAETGQSCWKSTLVEAPVQAPQPFALAAKLASKVAEVKEEAADAHELNTPLLLQNNFLQDKVADLHAALSIRDEHERLRTGQKIFDRGYSEWAMSAAASTAAASAIPPRPAAQSVEATASEPPQLGSAIPEVYEDGPHVDDSWRLTSNVTPWKQCDGAWTPPVNTWTGDWGPQRKRVATQLTQLHGSEVDAWQAGWRWAAEQKSRKSQGGKPAVREHTHHYYPPSDLVRTHSIEIGIAGLLDGDMKELLPKLLSVSVHQPAPLASSTLPAGPYARRQLFHRNAIVSALGMRSLGSGGPCVTTRNTAEYLNYSLKTPVVCLNGLWHPEAPLFAGAPTGKLYCHGDCKVGETIEAFVQRFTPSGQVFGWEYLGQYRQSSSGDACFADMRGPMMEKTRRKYAQSLLEQQNMWDLLLVVAERVGESLQISNCEARDAKALAATNKVMSAAEYRGDVFPATGIEFVGYNEGLYELLMGKKAYEHKTSSYLGRVWDGTGRVSQGS